MKLTAPIPLVVGEHKVYTVYDHDVYSFITLMQALINENGLPVDYLSRPWIMLSTLPPTGSM